MTDDIVAEVRRVREELIEQHGGIDGYFKYCQLQDMERARRLKMRRKKRTANVRSHSGRAG